MGLETIGGRFRITGAVGRGNMGEVRRAEDLDAAPDSPHRLESFQSESGGLKNNEIAKFGGYRTKRLVLAEYDRMAAAGLTLENPLTEGESGTYRSTLTPPPGQGPRHG
nr:hypothetical protein [Streptomyces barkulensis]